MPCGFTARPSPCWGSDTPPGLSHTAWSDGSITHSSATKVPSFAAALTSETVANLLRAASRSARVSTGTVLPAGTPTSSSAVAEEFGEDDRVDIVTERLGLRRARSPAGRRRGRGGGGGGW